MIQLLETLGVAIIYALYFLAMAGGVLFVGLIIIAHLFGDEPEAYGEEESE